MTCQLCLERGKTWSGSDPQCAFAQGAEFSGANWSCATVNAIRGLCGAWESTREGVHHEWVDDQHFATIVTHDVELAGGHSWCLWVTWYKRRGCTGAMWLLGDEDDGPPRRPTEADLLAILALYAPKQKEAQT